MSFYIVNIDTGRAWGKAYWTKQEYTSERGAKIACTKMNKATGALKWKVMNRKEYDARPVEMVERTNLMTGVKYMEPADTPIHCSPAFESYWSA